MGVLGAMGIAPVVVPKPHLSHFSHLLPSTPKLLCMFPVEAIIPAIAASLARNRDVVLRAPPGSGKTTCVPPALLDAPFLGGKKILMLEPRRLAARAAASYLARKRGEEVGDTIGFQVRLERKISSRTRLEIVTEGLLTQRLLSDPELSDVGLVIFDEFHERSLQCDTGFAMALDVRRALRPDLRLLVMSATLDTESIAAHLGDADVHTAEARMFPVETRYLREEPRAPIPSVVAGAILRALADTEGDILAFLPGEGEIRRAAEELRAAKLPPHVVIRPLFGALPRAEQDAAVAPSRPGERKVVLATSIAETSLTIEGVRTVVDCGWMRVPRFSPRDGMSRLETLRITRDRAEQRRGRAGRVAPGVCYRLWTEATDHSLPERMLPEILDADLAPTVLTCAVWGATKLDGLPWLTPPPAANWENATRLLDSLGALEPNGAATARGKRMADLPVHPRLAHMIFEAAAEGAANAACNLAAILAELPNGGPRRETDLRRIVDLVRARPGDPFAHRVGELADRWSRGYPERDRARLDEGVMLAWAFPDRVAKKRANGSFVLSSGRGATMELTESLATADYLVCAELNDAPGDARIHLAAPISEEAIEDLFKDTITETTVTEWDKRTDAVRAVRQRRLGKLVLREGGQSEPDADGIFAALCEGIRAKGIAQLPWSPGTRQLQARIEFLRRELPEQGWPDVSDGSLAAHLEDWFGGFLGGMSRWSHLQKLDLSAVLNFALSEAHHDARELDRLAPLKMEVPSGSFMTIHYEEAEPFVAVRIQETFGLKETPKLAGGRVPVLMKLLSPAQRPVQITKDLASFWREGYALVRKDLRGRYPKHYWPEDPTTAIATHRVRPRPRP